MKEGWSISKLSSLTSKIGSGATPRGGQKSYKEEGISLIRSLNIYDAGFTKNKLAFIDEEQAAKLDNVEIQKADVLINITGASVARCCVVDPSVLPARVNQHVSILRTKRELISPSYLHYYLTSPESKTALLEIGEQGATRQAITKTQLQNYPIPVPPLVEQEAIVEVLDKAFAAIDQAKANIEQNITNAKELFQSKLNQIFSQKGEGWVEKTLGDIGTLTSSKRIFKKDYVTSGVPFYRSKEIKELAHGREISLELFITRERYEEIKIKFGIPQKGDILLTAVGTIGEMYVVQGNEEFYFKDGNLMWLKNFDSLDSYYLKYALTHFVDQLKAMSRGTAYSALTIEKLKKYSIPVPSDERQKEMVLLLDSFRANQNLLIETYQTKLASLDELKKSILQKAFAGELT